MILEIILIIITLIVLLIASYSDLRIREVPDWLNYGLIFSALGIRAIFSFIYGWEIIVSGIFGFIVCLGLAYLFYYTHQWGGGDSKLLMAMGAVIGITFPFNNTSWDLALFFFALIFFGAFYGLLWITYMAIRKRKHFFPEFKSNFHKKKFLHNIILIVTLLLLLLGFYNLSLLFFAIFPLLFFYLFLYVETAEDVCFLTTIDVDNLTEGDWLAEDVRIKSETVLVKKTLEKEDLRKLKQMKLEDKLKEVHIREGIPFIPSFLLAYLILIFGKDMFSFLLKLFT
jgi:Flp pilus assembly protein protease CpaA